MTPDLNLTPSAVALSEGELDLIQGGGLSLTNYLTAGGAIVGGAAMCAFGLVTAPLTFGGSAAVGMTVGASLIGAGVGALSGTVVEAVKG